MRALRLPIVVGFSTVAALLLGVTGCGAPANNSGLFAASGGASVVAGGSVGQAGAGNAASSANGGSGGAADGGGTAGATPNGGAPSGGVAGSAAGGAPSGGASGAAGGGMPSAGTGGAPMGGTTNTSGGSGGTGGGGELSDCSAFGSQAMYYSETKHCYLVVKDEKMFAEAKGICSALGAHLVTLENQQENDFVWSLDANEHWIGATDGKGLKETSPGTYAWVDGEPFTYTDWSQGQPNASPSACTDGNGGGMCYEHCAFQWSGGAVPGEWNDRLCTHMIETVCEWDN